MLKQIIATLTISLFTLLSTAHAMTFQQANLDVSTMGAEVSFLYKNTGIKSTFQEINSMTKNASKNVHKTIVNNDISKGFHYIYKGTGAKSVVDTTSNVFKKTFNTMSREIKNEYSGSFIQKTVNSTVSFISKLYEVSGLQKLVKQTKKLSNTFFKHF